MAYYGFQHRYGANVRDTDGDLMGTLTIFRTRKARDTWVAEGNDFVDQPGAREALRSKAAAHFQRISGAVETIDA